jgi:2-keto-4-pentenoate hydratase/2-oxohepta-3-ene-1,7-dioic acid hydratase in catechol pathway
MRFAHVASNGREGVAMGTPTGPAWPASHRYGKDGDTVEVEIERLGVLRNKVKAAVLI